jgi:16S rRNA (uracil1498-N3)-methyltransferase
VGGRRETAVIALLVSPGTLATGARVILQETEVHHARVRRAEALEIVKLLDGAGGTAEARLLKEGRGLVAEVLSVVRVPAPVQVILAVGAGERDRFALVVEKAGELGATDVIPLQTMHSGAVAAQTRARHTESFQRRAREAIKQCGSAWAVRVREPVTLAEFLAAARLGSSWLADAAGMPRPAIKPDEPLEIAVGPEAGFTADERRLVLAAGFRSVALGPHVLRFETAAIAALAVQWQARQGDPL